MTMKDCIMLSVRIGDALAIASLYGGEVARTEMYNEVYTDLVSFLRADNPAFNSVKFAYAVGCAEGKYLRAAHDCGREVPS